MPNPAISDMKMAESVLTGVDFFTVEVLTWRA